MSSSAGLRELRSSVERLQEENEELKNTMSKLLYLLTSNSNTYSAHMAELYVDFHDALVTEERG